MILRILRTSSWHVSKEVAQQQNTLNRLVVDSQEAALNVSSELAAQRNLIQENGSWAQRLTNLLSWYVAYLAHEFGHSSLRLRQLSIASSCHDRGPSWQDIDHGQANNRYSDAARKHHYSS